MLPIIVLAGGFGTRLRSVVRDVPKILAPVLEKPFLFWLLNNLERQGVQKVLLSLHYQADLVKQELEIMKLKLEVKTLEEPTPLGTGGAIAFAVSEMNLKQDFLVMNGDTWLGESIMTLNNVSSPALGLINVTDSSRFGKVEWEKETVTQFREKGFNSGPGWINAGIYRLNASVFKNWGGQAFSLEHDTPYVDREGYLNACPLETDFIDIGIPEDYKRFCSYLSQSFSQLGSSE